MKIKLPNDSDGKALSFIAQRGWDMHRPVKFEFAIHAADEDSSQIVAGRLRAAQVGDAIEVVCDEGELEDGEEITQENKDFLPVWTVYVAKTMIPSYDAVVQFQQSLAELCLEAGKPDGWNVEID